MVFSSTIFLFAFLPLALAAYFAAPRRLRNAVLLAASLVFYTWGEKQYTLVLIGSILGNYAAGVWIGRTGSRLALAAAVAGNLLVLIGFKYANFLADNLNLVLQPLGFSAVQLDPIHLPIGVSFFTFQGIAYVADVYLREVPPAPNPVRYALYAALFPHLVAGPIVRYRDIAGQLGRRRVTLELFASGVQRLVVGLAKKLIIANTLGQYADLVFRLPAGEASAGLAWLGLACYSFQIYFDFSGYSDMAIGLGRMFGFTFLENFNYPYVAASVTEFWRRWHISLSTWLRDYVYIPLGGSRRGPLRTYANLLAVFVLCGAWHGASWTFVLWGAWHGAFLIGERVLGLGRRGWSPVRQAYTLVAVMLGWVLFRAESPAHAVDYFAALFGASSARITVADVWNAEVLAGLVLAAVASLPVVPWVKSRVAGDAWGWRAAGLEWAGAAACASLGLVLMPCLCAGSYNPFLYFRF
jgi:alginate O-acetyltransferase complex protein AlgI